MSHPPESVLIRVPTADDAERVARFVNTRGADVAASTLAGWWNAAAQGRGEARLAEDPSGALLGYGFAYPVDGGKGHLPIDLRIDPRAEIDAITGELLDSLEAGIQRLATAAGRGRSVVARGRVESIGERSEHALQARGYGVVGGSFRIEMVFDEPPPEPAYPAGTAIRTFRRGIDEEAFHTVLAESWAESPALAVEPFDVWIEQFRAGGFDETLWFIASQDGQDIAVGNAVHHTHDPSWGWITELGVLIPWRRHGVGMALMQHMFWALYPRGARHIGGAVDFSLGSSSLRFHIDVGMRVVEDVVVFERQVRRANRGVAAAAQVRGRLRRGRS